MGDGTDDEKDEEDGADGNIEGDGGDAAKGGCGGWVWSLEVLFGGLVKEVGQLPSSRTGGI